MLLAIKIVNQQAIVVDAENISVLQLHLTSTLKRDVIQQHARNVTAVGQATFALCSNMHDSLQARNSAIVVGQYQIIIHASTDSAAWRKKIETDLRRFMAGFSGYYRKAHHGFLRLAVRHLYRASLGEKGGI